MSLDDLLRVVGILGFIALILRFVFSGIKFQPISTPQAGEFPPKPGPILSAETLRRVNIMFSEGPDRERAQTLLYDRLGNSQGSLPQVDVERLRFAALKYSKGTLDELQRAVDLAEVDWRDLLCAAGFASDPDKNGKWEPGTSRKVAD